MDKIDRLGWAAGISFVSYGLRIGIRVSNPEVLNRLPDVLPPHWKPARSPKVERLYSLVVGGDGPRANIRRFNVLYADAARLARTMELGQTLEALELDLQLYVAERARRRLFVHAGVVGWQGRAIIVPGSSFSGKTTLVTALVRAGATYYSDEYAVFDKRGRVHPYPRPPRIRQDNGGQSKHLALEDVGVVTGEVPLPVGCIVVTEYNAQKRWRPRRLSPGRAALELFAHAVPARRRPKSALATLGQVAAGAKAFKGVRGEAEETVDCLLNKASEQAFVVPMANGPARVAVYGG